MPANRTNHAEPSDDDSDGEADDESEGAFDIAELDTTYLIQPDIERTVAAWRETWARQHDQEADRADQEAHALQGQLEADREALRAAHGRYLERLLSTLERDALQPLEAEVTAYQQRVAADNAALDACRARARQHRQAARDLRWATFREQQGNM